MENTLDALSTNRVEELAAPGVPARRALVVYPPQGVGVTGVILFIHGFALSPYCYSALSESFASHGFAVVLPQVYKATDAAGSEVPSVVAWSARAVAKFRDVPFIMASHSRGGQVSLLGVFAGASDTICMPRVSAIILFDPVEGAPSLCGLGELQPLLLANNLELWKLDASVPVLVFGALLGTEGVVPAAPVGHNFDAIWDGFVDYARRQTAYGQSDARMFQIVHSGFGHIDYLNDPEDCRGIVAKLAQLVTKSGRVGRGYFRKFLSDVCVLFLKTYVTQSCDGQEWRQLLDNIAAQGVVRVRRLETSLAVI